MADVVVIDEDLFDMVDRDLQQIQYFERGKALKSAMRGVGNVVKKQTLTKLPMPGYPGDKEGLKPLRKTARVRVIQYSSGRVVTIFGYAYPAGAHGHLLEEGHDMQPHKSSRPRKKVPTKSRVGRPKDYKTVTMGGKIEGKHYIDQADSETKAAQRAALEAGIKSQLPNRGGA